MSGETGIAGRRTICIKYQNQEKEHGTWRRQKVVLRLVTQDATRENDRVCVIRVDQSGCELYCEGYGALLKGFKKGTDMLRFVL